MFKDIGFVLELAKDLIKTFAIILYFVSCFAMYVAPQPWNWIFMAYALFGILYWWVPLTREVLQDKYKRYRARKEEAWNVLKDTK